MQPQFFGPMLVIGAIVGAVFGIWLCKDEFWSGYTFGSPAEIGDSFSGCLVGLVVAALFAAIGAGIMFAIGALLVRASS